MNCQWERFLALLPKQIAAEADRLGRDTLQELRLRLHNGAEGNLGNKQVYFRHTVTADDLSYILNAASRYSPWQAETLAKGYVTAPGGHRIGVCGEAVTHQGMVQGIRNVDSLCIRIARDFPGIGRNFQGLRDSLLLLGPPGYGKTTLLRDIARTVAETETVAVVDEREELFPTGFSRGKRMDVLRLCPKAAGMDMALRTLGPVWIAVDEITEESDCDAILRCANCGVKLLATAHGSSLGDLRRRPVYRKLLEADVFPNVVILQKDNSFVWERKELWK